MPTVTANVRTWGFEPFPADERLVVSFYPSSAGMAGAAVFPKRKVQVIPDVDGHISVELTQTTDVIPDVWFEVRFEWFDRHIVDDSWQLRGWSELPGKLRVPAEGGSIPDLIDTPPPPGAVLHGFGDPPSSLSNVLYIDRSGVHPILWAPPGGGI